ncbi:MAG TPA: hypothetical protein VGC09_18125 [Rhodopila sp.]
MILHRHDRHGAVISGGSLLPPVFALVGITVVFYTGISVNLGALFMSIAPMATRMLAGVMVQAMQACGRLGGHDRGCGATS